MSITKVKKNRQNKINNLDTRWDEAIADAKDKIRRLRMAIKVFKARRGAGESWPGIAENLGK